MSHLTELPLPLKLRQRLHEVATEKRHGQVTIDYQNGVVYRWSISEYGHVPKTQTDAAPAL